MKHLIACALLCSSMATAETTNSTLTGTVSRYLLAPRGEVDGLYLSDGTSVKFPPHLGEELVAIVKPGDSVNVDVDRGPSPSGQFGQGVHAYSITNKMTGKVITDTPPQEPPRPPRFPEESRSELSAKAKWTSILVNDRGEIDGFLLKDGTQVKFPPHIGTELERLIDRKNPAEVTASGPGIKTGFGTVIDATSLAYAGRTVAGLEPRGPRRP